jgi:cardiolipin synthase
MKIWKEIHLFHSGDEFLTALLTALQNARSKITLEFYIFEIDEISQLLLEELRLAVQRGCKVQLLVDGVGSLFSIEALRLRCEKDGVQFQVYHPLPTFFEWLGKIPSAFRRKPPTLLRRANRRNHRKVVIVDAEIAFLGSVNMTRVHFEKAFGTAAWRDSSVRLTGPPIESLTAAFELAWARSRTITMLATDSDLDTTKKTVETVLKWQSHVRLNVNLQIRRQLYKDLRRRIMMAEKRVYIVTAYFLPKRAVVRALAKAAERGVDIRIIIPGPSDVPLVKWIADQVTTTLLQAGVHVFEYQPRILHAKYMLIDDWSSLGSFNLNHRSLLHDLEVEAVLTDYDSLENLHQQFLEDLRQSNALDSLKYEQSPWWKRGLAKFLFKLRYWF